MYILYIITTPNTFTILSIFYKTQKCLFRNQTRWYATPRPTYKLDEWDNMQRSKF